MAWPLPTTLPLRVLPGLVLRLLGSVLVGPLLAVLSLAAPLLPLLLLGRLAAARHDAVQHTLVPLRPRRVRLHQRLQLVPHDAVLLVPGEVGGGDTNSLLPLMKIDNFKTQFRQL